MKEIKIEHLAYSLKQAKEKGEPQPIFFLGAGASRTGNIPLAREIIKDIMTEYADSPFIKDLQKDSRTYANLMDCLLPAQRSELLKNYIREAKINVTHIYLAQLLHEGYIDYMLTVNFDNLMLRALALYGIFPATYDMAILKDLTTTTFKEESVVYLHGQNHGLWLLNTPEEMNKVKAIVPRILDSIKNGRPWIFIGYSGEDPIFEHIKNLGRFDNGLYWVSYNDNEPNENVREFLSEPNTNAFLVKGYDSDSFMLKLNNELGLDQPNIVNRPFTAVKEMLNEIVDIDDKDHFKGVKERLEISKRQVDEAILQFELGKMESVEDLKEGAEVDLLKKEIINLLISDNYDEEIISDIIEKAGNFKDSSLLDLLSSLFSNWGLHLANIAEIKELEEAEALYSDSFEKYKKAIEIKADNYDAYINWGVALDDLALLQEKKEIAEKLINEAIEKYKKAIEFDSNSYIAYCNWATSLGNLAVRKDYDEAIEVFIQAFDKFGKAIDINPHKPRVYYNWGTTLLDLIKAKNDESAENTYLEAIEKFSKSIELDGGCYNLSCLHAIRGNKKDALFYLQLSLKNKETSVLFIERDKDWVGFLNDEAFLSILRMYR